MGNHGQLMELSIKVMHVLIVFQVAKFVIMIKHVKLVGKKEALVQMEIFVSAEIDFIQTTIRVRLVSEGASIVRMVSHATFVMDKTTILLEIIIHVFAIKLIIMLMVELNVYAKEAITNKLMLVLNVQWDAQHVQVYPTVQNATQINKLEMEFVNAPSDSILMIKTFALYVRTQLDIVLNVIRPIPV